MGSDKSNLYSTVTAMELKSDILKRPRMFVLGSKNQTVYGVRGKFVSCSFALSFAVTEIAQTLPSELSSFLIFYLQNLNTVVASVRNINICHGSNNSSVRRKRTLP